MQQNPNATATILAGYLATMLLYGASSLGVDLPMEVAAAITGFTITLVILLGPKRKAKDGSTPPA